jgi:transcriptional regulator with XRE-family HTH domain
MDGEPWQRRLKDMGISQLELAEAIGMTPTNLSTGLRGKWKHGVPQDLKALILALERLSEGKRAEWLIAAKAERKRPDGGK